MTAASTPPKSPGAFYPSESSYSTNNPRLEGYTGPLPEPGGYKNFKLVAQSKEEEDAFEFQRFVEHEKPYGKLACLGHLVKGALGAGLLSSHCSYKFSGVIVTTCIIIFGGLYYGFCMNILVQSVHKMYRRTRQTKMSYPDLGEASCACHHSPLVQKFSLVFRYWIDLFICMDLFGCCACYQIIIARSIKQLIEKTIDVSDEPTPPHTWGVRHYLAVMIIPIIMICLIRHLKYLAPFALVADAIILGCMIMTVYYSMQNNPKFKGLKMTGGVGDFTVTTGMIIFGLNFSGVIVPVTNGMGDPSHYRLPLMSALVIIVMVVFVQALFGYNAYIEKSQSPITINFPMTTAPQILKVLIAVMVYVTHALNFWAPFELCFFYIKRLLKNYPDKIVTTEYVLRATICVIISLFAIAFPDVDNIISFIGCLCLSNMGMIWPNLIYLLVISVRPGYGPYHWKLIRGLLFIAFGLFIMFCGSFVSLKSLLGLS